MGVAEFEGSAKWNGRVSSLGKLVLSPTALPSLPCPILLSALSAVFAYDKQRGKKTNSRAPQTKVYEVIPLLSNWEIFIKIPVTLSFHP